MIKIEFESYLKFEYFLDECSSYYVNQCRGEVREGGEGRRGKKRRGERRGRKGRGGEGKEEEGRGKDKEEGGVCKIESLFVV